MTAKRAAPVTERGRQSRQRIAEAAERIFGEKGYFRTSISDITREAGTALGTFYVYFDSKHDVFVEVLQGFARLIRQTTRAALGTGHDRIEEEERGFAAFFALIDSHPYLYRIVRQAEFVDPEAFRSYYAGIVRGYEARLRAAMVSGEVRALHPEALVYCLLGIGDLIGMRWAYWTGKPIPPDVFDSMMQFIRFGMDRRGTGSTNGEKEIPT
ncbi:MAG: TetR/AcrR family transcriptional regulator [Candidatus Rokubacteria bacterium]|nr:TetR/AcrR family transcriptional regulator [Candidatus Rokubacteria bacterium]